MFGHLRLFSFVSLIVVIVIAALAGMFVRNMALEDLKKLTESTNTSIAQGYIDQIWKRHREIIVPLSNDPAQLAAHPQVQQFAQDTVMYFQKMPIIRVNIYSGSGMLLMRSDVSQPGDITASSPDSSFVQSQMKQPVAGSRILVDLPLKSNPQAKLVQTVVPIRVAENPNLEGGIEMVTDISSSWEKLLQFQIYSTGGIIGLFLLFMLVLFITGKKAETIIAKQHETNVELAEAAAAAQAENRDKSQFLANISHELRTPLNAIIGFSDIIKNEVMPKVEEKKYHDYITDIHGSGVHLLSLINDILDYSKAEAGKLALEVSEINATKMVQNSMRMVSPRAESGQVALAEELPKEPLTMITDGKKFKQVLLNLLSNAVKFTPAGGEVKVTAWHSLTDDTICFEVKDTGIGIAPKDISRAMAPFGQVDNTLKRKYEGTGLGLPLTKKFIELMGGKFNIESEVGKGTKIMFQLPRELKEREGVIVKQAT